MGFIKRFVCICDECGHEWMPRQVVDIGNGKKTVRVLPANCAKCKSRNWNKDDK